MCETGGWGCFWKRQEICEWKTSITVPFTSPYSVNIVWVSCLYVLWEGARRSYSYRHVQSERNGWQATIAYKHIIHNADRRDSMDLFSIWLCARSNVLRLLLFMCLLCLIAGHTLYSDWFGLRHLEPCLHSAGEKMYRFIMLVWCHHSLI